MGTARSDSTAGVVYVDVGGDVVSGDGSQAVPVATSQDVREGDRVIVSLYGPDGKTVGLLGFQHNSTTLFLKCLKVRISGTAITTEAGWGGEYALGGTSGTGNVIRIVRVLGWEL